MGRRSAGDNDQQLSVADLLRATSNDRQPRRSRRHGDSNLAAVRDDPEQSAVTLPSERVGATSANPKEIQQQASDLAAPPSEGVGPDPKQRQVTEPAGEPATSMPDGVSAVKGSGQVSELATDLPIPPRDGVSARQRSDQTVAQGRERRVETTGAQALEVLDAETAAKNADSQLASAFAFLSAPDPAEHSVVPTTTPLSDVGPTGDLDTAEVPAVDERDASAESSSSTATAGPAEVEPMPNTAMPTPAETEPGTPSTVRSGRSFSDDKLAAGHWRGSSRDRDRRRARVRISAALGHLSLRCSGHRTASDLRRDRRRRSRSQTTATRRDSVVTTFGHLVHHWVAGGAASGMGDDNALTARAMSVVDIQFEEKHHE